MTWMLRIVVDLVFPLEQKGLSKVSFLFVCSFLIRVFGLVESLDTRPIEVVFGTSLDKAVVVFNCPLCARQWNGLENGSMPFVLLPMFPTAFVTCDYGNVTKVTDFLHIIYNNGIVCRPLDGCMFFSDIPYP